MAPPPDAESIAALLLRWQRGDLELRRGLDLGQGRHDIATRDDLSRRFAAMIDIQAKTLVPEDLLLPELTAASVSRPRAAHNASPTREA